MNREWTSIHSLFLIPLSRIQNFYKIIRTNSIDKEPTNMPPKIFVVVPNWKLRYHIVQMLGFEGYSTDQAANLAELKQPCPFVPDLIIWDIGNPETNSDELLKYLKDDPIKAEIPRILLTLADHPLDSEAAKSLDADTFLTKPFHAAELLKKIGIALPPSPSQYLDIQEREC